MPLGHPYKTFKLYPLYFHFSNMNPSIKIKPGYKFEYYVRDEHTGDLKTQEERRQGDDYISGSYSIAGEPNGNLRVVTYNADHKNGFNAHVQNQPGGPPINGNTRGKEKHLEEIMKVIPKYQVRSGFPQLDVKIIPPKLSSTTTKLYEVLEESVKKEKGSEVGENSVKLNASDMTQWTFSGGSDEANSIVSTTIVSDLLHSEASVNNQTENTNKSAMSKQVKIIISTTPRDLSQSEECSDLCSTKMEEGEQEGRAHIKPHEDRVQLEMEQVIRAEMQEPTGVNLGVPYQNSEQNGNEQHFMKPLNIDYKPLPSEEDIMKEGDSTKANKQSLNTNSESTIMAGVHSPPYLLERNVFMFPYKMNGEEKGWSRVPSIRYPDMSRAMLAHSLSLAQPSKHVTLPQPLYTTGIAFFVLPRP